MESIKGILSLGILVGLLYFLPKYVETREFRQKASEDYDINYEGMDIECNPPFEQNGRQFFKLTCEEYQYNKIDYIENNLCKTGNDVVYGGVRYFVLGCFRQPNDIKKVVFHVMVEPDIKDIRSNSIAYNVNNNVSGVMNGDFVFNVNERENIELLISEIQNFHSKVRDESLKKDLELFECKLRLGEVNKNDANNFIDILDKYKNIPTYVSGIAAVTNAVLNVINFFNAPS